MRPPSALVIDLDGTLVDTVPTRIQAWASALRAAGFRVDRRRIGSLIGMDGRRLVREIAAGEGRFVTDDEAEEVELLAGRQYDLVNVDPRPLPGARGLLKLSADPRIPWVIATSSRADQARVSLAALQLSPSGPLIVDGDGVMHAKPAPDLLLRAAEMLGVSSLGCWCIGDSIWDIRAATAAGMSPVGVTTGATLEADLVRAGARAVVPSLANVVEHLADRGD